MVRSYIDFHKRRQLLANIIITIVVLVILFFLVVNFVTIPYTVDESYEAEEPFEELEFYNETMQEEILVPHTKQVEVETEIAIRPPSAKLDMKPVVGFRREQDCHFADYEYEIDYITNTLGPNRYDMRTGAGFRDGRLFIIAEICNKEKRRMNTDFKICKYWKDEKVDCQDRLSTMIRANRCVKKTLTWETDFDAEKTLKLELGAVSQKIMCRNRALKMNEDSPEFVAVSLDPTGTDYGRYLMDPVRLKTQSGYLAIPKSEESLYRHEVTTATKKETKELTEFKKEVVDKVVEKNRTVSKTRTVTKTRPITKYRTLWQHLMLKLRD